MLRGRESLIRLVGKRRRFLPNRKSLLSDSTSIISNSHPPQVLLAHHLTSPHLTDYDCGCDFLYYFFGFVICYFKLLISSLRRL